MKYVHLFFWHNLLQETFQLKKCNSAVAEPTKASPQLNYLVGRDQFVLAKRAINKGYQQLKLCCEPKKADKKEHWWLHNAINRPGQCWLIPKSNQFLTKLLLCFYGPSHINTDCGLWMQQHELVQRQLYNWTRIFRRMATKFRPDESSNFHNSNVD